MENKFGENKLVTYSELSPSLVSTLRLCGLGIHELMFHFWSFRRSTTHFHWRPDNGVSLKWRRAHFVMHEFERQRQPLSIVMNQPITPSFYPWQKSVRFFIYLRSITDTWNLLKMNLCSCDFNLARLMLVNLNILVLSKSD